ncbi:MAG: hypothetical protein IKQ80_01710 [Clostridia bacterium]|nr:hypothetical protein [Clostridia bacterium]
MKLWCFGDSNTYGYDPCGFFGGRYAAPWPELLAEKTGNQVVNDGKNGRMIPGREYEFTRFHRDAGRYGADALIVLLGANDLLNGATAGEAAARMAAFLKRSGFCESHESIYFHIILVLRYKKRRPDHSGLCAEGGIGEPATVAGLLYDLL